MNRTMITATNTLAQLQKQMDLISNNMANVDTNGFKRKEATFTDLLYQQFNNKPVPENEVGRVSGSDVGRLTPNGIRQGTGAKLAQAQLIMTQGNIKTTDRPLDTAFTKEGQLYKILVQNGNRSEINYTRNGALYLTPVTDNEIMVVNGDGNPILDENNNPIYINGEAKEYAINENGHLAVKMTNGTTQDFELGVVQVNKPQLLEQKGNNLYGLPTNFAELGVTEDEVLTDLQGPLRRQIGLQQGVLEQSNVDMSKEMTNLISVQRAYQFQSKAVSLAEQMMGLVNGIR